MPTILLHGDPRGWGTNNRPTKQPLVKASAGAWVQIATPIEVPAAFAVRFLWPDPQRPDHWGSNRVIDTDGTATVAKAVLDGAVRAGIIEDDGYRQIERVTLWAPSLVSTGWGILASFGPLGSPPVVNGRFPERDYARRKHGGSTAYKAGCRCDECVRGDERRRTARAAAKRKTREAARAERLARFLDEVGHGHPRAFRAGCRCAACVAVGPRAPIEHGTKSGYYSHGCRCDLCRGAYRDYYLATRSSTREYRPRV